MSLCVCGYFCIWFSVVHCLTWVNQQSTGRASWKILVSAGKTAFCCSMDTAQTRWHSLLPDGKRDNSKSIQCCLPLQGNTLPWCLLCIPALTTAAPGIAEQTAGWFAASSCPLLWVIAHLVSWYSPAHCKLWRIIWIWLSLKGFFPLSSLSTGIPAYMFLPFWWIWTGG